MTDGAVLEVAVWRGGETGDFQSFAIPRREHQAVLDVVTENQRQGLRVLAVEFFDFREQTLAVLSVCLAAVFAVGHVFILNLD